MRVPVPDVVRRVLEEPLQPARLRVEGQHGVGVEVVAPPLAAVVVRARIAGRPVERVELGVVGPGEPGGGAAVLDVLALPRLRSRLYPFRHRPEAPRLLAGRLVEGGQEAARAFIAARRAGDHQAAHGERRRGRAVVLVPVGHLGVPSQRAREAVEREDVGVVGDHEDEVACHRDAAVGAPGGIAGQALRARAPVRPDAAAAPGVERVDLVGGRHVHDPVHHERRHRQPRGVRQGIRPAGGQPGHARPVDLVEGAVAVAVEPAVVGRPVRLRRHRPVPLTLLPQQVDAPVVIEREELEVERGTVEWNSGQRAPVGGLDRDRSRRPSLLGAQGAQEGDQLAHLAIRDREAGHARGGQPLAEERCQLVVAAQGQPRHDRRPALATVAVSAVAGGAGGLELAAAGLGGLGEGGRRPGQRDENRRGWTHGRGRYHDRADGSRSPSPPDGERPG